MNEQEFRMPFGKHRGTPVKDIPADYLLWLRKNVELRGPLAAAVKDALTWKHIPIPEAPQASQPAPRPVAPAMPKRQWRPGPETEDLSGYYSQGANDGIPW
jgi:uncharacterized protein (DUF3820 family)